MNTNDCYTVERDRYIDTVVVAEQSGSYATLGDARSWADKLIKVPGTLAVRIKKHSWSAEVVSEFKP